jgi:hypothetical protein
LRWLDCNLDRYCNPCAGQRNCPSVCRCDYKRPDGAGATIGYRFAVTDRDTRRLRKSFPLYLAPTVIEKMMASKHPPRLGDETRSITIFGAPG